ncbi:cold-shock protein [Pedobacter sp. N23S346]|uniref:cold-shock protein n=1 Tax=Pedobacter sp. N23S346 TaxID=3402750 RepID=UPI003ACFA3D8
MATGKVKWFNTQKGFGFILQEDNTDLFVHFKDVLGGIDGIQEGDSVEFEVADGKKGLQAINVKKVS